VLGRSPRLTLHVNSYIYEDSHCNKENAQISADSQVTIVQTNSATSNNLVVSNKGLLHSNNVLNISADILNNKKNIVANKIMSSAISRGGI
jgi:hypothetical protein